MERINIYWFKRDLRLFDNEAFYEACKSSKPIFLIYVYEPSLMQDAHYTDRHWRFIKESIDDLNNELKSHDTKVFCIRAEVIDFFKKLTKEIKIDTVFSTNETGLNITYERDIEFSEFCKNNRIQWKEFQNGAVQRGIKNRDKWSNAWYSYMKKEIEIPNIEKVNFDKNLPNIFKENEYTPEFIPNPNFQKGGRSRGKDWENSFFEHRIENYNDYISKPELSRLSCSRLSPYFAWGCLSVREVYQRSLELKQNSDYKRNFTAFNSRLRWQAHFVQKFEMEPRIEYEAFNKGYLDFEYNKNDDHLERWKDGRTGYPLVDACMRAVKQTGYINFRMRSMCVSFLVHHLFQHYAEGSIYLASQFLDFEPGIHYAQFQMQAGLTATNTVRVYNPTKNAHDHDSEAIFIKKYVPELGNLPASLAIEPWLIEETEASFYNFNYGKDYPERIVDISETRKHALSKLYGHRKNQLVQKEKSRILNMHTIKRKSLQNAKK